MKKLLKKVKVVVAIVVLATIMVGCKSGDLFKSGKEIDISNMVITSNSESVTLVHGANGEGVLNIDAIVNEDDISDEIMNVLEIDNNDFSAITEIDNILSFVRTVQENADKSEKLSNGDKIKVTISYDEEMAKELGIYLSNLEYEINVEGLPEAKRVDVFACVKLNFRDENEVTLDNNRCDIEGSIRTYNVDSDTFVLEGKTVALEPGEKVHVKLADEALTELTGCGIIPEETEKEYVYEGVLQSVKKISSLSEEQKEKIKSDFENNISSLNENSDGQYIDLEYVGMYYAEGATKGWFPQEIHTLMPIYKAKYSSKSGAFDEQESCIVGKFEDLVATKSLYIDYSSSIDLLGNAIIGNYGSGFKTLDEAKNELQERYLKYEISLQKIDGAK